MTTIALTPQAPPLRQDEEGAIRVGQTRIPLERIIHAYLDGATPETIVERYDTLDLGDVYAVIGFYLSHRDSVDAYCRQREAEADRLQEQVQANQPGRPGFKAELLARLARRKNGNAATRQ